jgi:hypothetical protein
MIIKSGEYDQFCGKRFNDNLLCLALLNYFGTDLHLKMIKYLNEVLKCFHHPINKAAIELI